MKNSHGGSRKGAGRKTRLTPKSKPIWCGQISESDRDFIVRWLSPDERFSVLMAAANNCVQADVAKALSEKTVVAKFKKGKLVSERVISPRR